MAKPAFIKTMVEKGDNLSQGKLSKDGKPTSDTTIDNAFIAVEEAINNALPDSMRSIHALRTLATTYQMTLKALRRAK